MSKSYGCFGAYLSASQLDPTMTVRTFTIHPSREAGNASSLDPMVLRCDSVSFSESCVAIANNEIRIIGQLANSSNGALLGEIEVGDSLISVVVKPSMYENPLWDFPWGTLAKREVAAYELSQLLGWNIVPPTILRDVNDMESSVQLFVPHDPRQHYFNFSLGNTDAMEKFAVFDYISNNADRKGGHILKEKQESFELFLETDLEVGDDGDSLRLSHATQRTSGSASSSSTSSQLWGIDHGLCFHWEDKLRTVIWEFSEEPINQDLLTDVNNALPKVAERLRPLLESHEIEATVTRIEKLLINPFHRALDATEQAFPWPLV
jgi:hypothetical protein